MDTKELLTVLGIEIDENETLSPDLLKKKLGEKYIDLDLHKREVDAAFGKARGTWETKLKPLLGDEAKDVSGDTLIDKLTARWANLNQQIEAAKGNKSAEEIAKIQKKADDLAALLEEANEKARKAEEAAQKAITDAKEEVEKEKLATKVAEIFNAQKWSETANEWAKKGLFAEISSKYDFKIENNKVMAYNKDGSICKIGTSHATADDVFQAEIKAAKLWKETPAGGGGKFVVDPSDPHAVRKAKALEHARRLREAAEKQ